MKGNWSRNTVFLEGRNTSHYGASWRRRIEPSDSQESCPASSAAGHDCLKLLCDMAAFIVQEEEVERAFRRECLFRDRVHPLQAYSEEELVKKYCFSREGILHIMGLLGEDTLNHPTARNHALPALLQVMIALNFFATGAIFDKSIKNIRTSHKCYMDVLKATTEKIAARKAKSGAATQNYI